MRTTASGAYLQALLAVTGELPAPERIGAPVLTLVAERNTFTDAVLLRTYLERLPDFEIVALPARHWIPTEQPQAMRAAIEGWVGRRFPAAV